MEGRGIGQRNARLMEVARSRTLIIFGLVLLVAGVAWPLIGGLGLGRLRGDIVIERPSFSLLLSADDLAHHQRGAEHDLVAGELLAGSNWT